MTENANGNGDGNNGGAGGDQGNAGGQHDGSGDQSGKDGQGQGSGDGKGKAGAGAGDGKGAAGQQGKGKEGAGDGKGGDGGEGEADKGTWPEDWQTRLAKGDEKRLKKLGRYASPEAVFDALESMQTKLSKGEIKVVTPLKADASPEELKAWRADNGIPETPEGYDTTIKEGHVWGEADKPLVDSFAKAAHEANLPPAAVKTALGWYEKLQQQQAEQRAGLDAQFKKDNIDELREEYGPEYRKEVRIIDEFFEGLPDGLGEVLLNARDGNGRPLGANAKLLRWANQMQREANPAGVVMPGAGVNSIQALQGELDKIEAAMKDKTSEYWRGPKTTNKAGETDTKMALRYRELLEAKERMDKRAA